MFWLLACSGSSETDPWAPPPLPESVEAPSPERAQLEAAVGQTLDASRVGAWIGQASDAAELDRRLAATGSTSFRELVLRPGEWPAPMLESLAAAPLDGVEVIDARGVVIEDWGPLASAPWWSGVTHVDLTGAQLGVDGTAALAAADLRRVRSLRLEDTDVHVDGLLTWRLGALEELDLSDNDLDEAAFKALVTSARLDAVTRLDLSSTSPGERAAFYVSTSPYVATLEHLDLRRNELTAEDWSDLRAAFGDDAIPMD